MLHDDQQAVGLQPISRVHDLARVGGSDVLTARSQDTDAVVSGPRPRTLDVKASLRGPSPTVRARRSPGPGGRRGGGRFRRRRRPGCRRAARRGGARRRSGRRRSTPIRSCISRWRREPDSLPDQDQAAVAQLVPGGQIVDLKAESPGDGEQRIARFHRVPLTGDSGCGSGHALHGRLRWSRGRRDRRSRRLARGRGILRNPVPAAGQEQCSGCHQSQTASAA